MSSPVATARAAYIRMGAEDKLGLYLQPNAGHVVTPIAPLVDGDMFELPIEVQLQFSPVPV